MFITASAARTTAKHHSVSQVSHTPVYLGQKTSLNRDHFGHKPQKSPKQLRTRGSLLVALRKYLQRTVAMFKCHRRCDGTGLLIPEETGQSGMHWGDRSAGKMFVLQAQSPEFDPQNPCLFVCF